MTEKTIDDPGAYLFSSPLQGQDRIIVPSDPEWNAKDYEKISGKKLDPCPCGESGDFVIFTTVHKIEENESESQMVVICASCAEAAGGFAKKQFG